MLALGVVGDEGQAFQAEVIDHGQDAKTSATGERIEHEGERPALVLLFQDRHRGSRSKRTLALAAPAHREPFLAIKPIDLFTVQHDAAFPP